MSHTREPQKDVTERGGARWWGEGKRGVAKKKKSLLLNRSHQEFNKTYSNALVPEYNCNDSYLL